MIFFIIAVDEHLRTDTKCTALSVLFIQAFQPDLNSFGYLSDRIFKTELWSFMYSRLCETGIIFSQPQMAAPCRYSY